MSALALLSQPLSLELEGVDLTHDVLALRLTEALSRSGSLEAALNNWGGSPPGFQYSDGETLKIGSKVRVYSGDLTLAIGVVATLSPNFNPDSPSTFHFSAQAKRLQRGPAENRLELRYGADLLEFHPVLQTVAKSRRRSIQAAGVVTGRPELQPGTSLEIDGVGANWSGLYAVTETLHTYDGSLGYRTRFTCIRRGD